MLFLLTWYYQLPEREWSLITVWFVMSEYTAVGGVLKKSFYRFAGTFLSALYGMIIIYFFDNNVMINILALTAGVFFYMHYFIEGEKTYIGVIGCVTLTIVLLNHNDLDAALLRSFNIIIGILASVFMIRFFYPRYAYDNVIEEQLNFVKQLATALDTYLDPDKTFVMVQADYQRIEKNIITHLATFDRHLSEARLETLTTPSFLIANQIAIEHVRHLFRLLSVLIQYLATDELRLNTTINYMLFEVLQRLSHAGDLLRQSVGQKEIDAPMNLDTEKKSPSENTIETLINTMNNEVISLTHAIEQMMSSGLYPPKPANVVELEA